MEPHQIKAALDGLGLTPQQAAKLFRHDTRSVQRWIYGERGVPQGIAILLQLMLAGKITAHDIEIAASKI